MDIRRIDDEVSVCAQIEASDLVEIAARGFRSIICNRPDRETAGQTDWAEIEAAAKELGFETCFLPVLTGRVSAADGADFRQALAELPKPVFAYCRSGTRCAQLWSLSEAGRRPVEDITKAAKAAGYDVAGLLSTI